LGSLYEKAERHVAHTQVTPNIRVSTVFLGIDHNFYGIGAPILFETMVFVVHSIAKMERYGTWERS